MQTKQFLYHMYPADFCGKKLMPLNRIRVQYPALYEAKVEKYKGREHLTKRVVPLLDCLWNDVIHLTNIHPREFYLAFQAAGRAPKADLLWLKVPIKYAVSNAAIVYACRTTTENRISVPDDEFSWFDMDKFGSSHLDQRTLEYYKKQAETGGRIFAFQGVAHFLIQGEIAVADCEIIRWDLEPDNECVILT